MVERLAWVVSTAIAAVNSEWLNKHMTIISNVPLAHTAVQQMVRMVQKPNGNSTDSCLQITALLKNA
jgi:hypothetical protein